MMSAISAAHPSRRACGAPQDEALFVATNDGLILRRREAPSRRMGRKFDQFPRDSASQL